MTQQEFPALGFDPAPGDPAALAATAQRLAGAAGAFQQHATTVSGLDAASWTGAAADEFSSRAAELSTDLGGAHRAHATAAQAMGRYAAELAEMKQRAVRLEAQAQELLARQRAAAAELDWIGAQRAPVGSPQLAALQSQYGSARAAHEQAGDDLAVLREQARSVLQAQRAAAATTARALRAQTPQTPPAAAPAAAATGTDPAAMKASIIDCIRRRELGKGGIRESELKTVAGVPASMATPNQTIITNAIDLLQRHPELRNQAVPPLTPDELAAAKKRCDDVGTLRHLAENRRAAAAKATAAATAATRARDAAKRLLDAKETTTKTLFDAWQKQAQAAQSAPPGPAATRAAAQAQATATAGQKALKQAEAAHAAWDAKAKAAEAATQAAEAATKGATDADQFIAANSGLVTATGLDRDDVKNMVLSGLKQRQGSLSAAERAEVSRLEADLGNRNRVTDQAVRTRIKWPGEDKAGWQRKAVNALDTGNGSVGQRINGLATSGDHMLLTTAFLEDQFERARRQNPTNETAIVNAVARAQNSGADYAPAILKCYQAKKNGK